MLFVTHITGSCTHTEFGELKRESAVHYISQQTTVCFTCPALQRSSPNLAINSYYWSFGDAMLSINETNSKGKVFPNGTLLIVNSSQAFSTDNATKLSCVNNSQTAESQSATVYLGGRFINAVKGLDTRNLNHYHVHTHTWIHTPHVLPTYTTHTLTHKDFAYILRTHTHTQHTNTH